MKRLMNFVAWSVILAIVSAVCMTAGLAVMYLTCNFDAGMCVFFFGTIAAMLALGMLD